MRTLLTPFLLLGAAFLQAQAPGGMLTAEQAVAIALENNHAVRIAKLDARSVEVANTAGNAGMLPTLSANGSYAMDNSATKQTFFSGEVREANNASFAAQGAYDDLVPAFVALFEREGRDWPRFHAAVRALAKMPQPGREEALKALAG